MAKATNYGMGQYRFNKNYSYIDKLNLDEHYKKYYKDVYEDVLITLPTTATGQNEGNNQESSITLTPMIQYGSTYFVRLTVPQNHQYTTQLNLKLCPGDTSTEQGVNVKRFQHIKTLIVPPTPENDDVYSTGILYEVPGNPSIVRCCVLDDGIHDWGTRLAEREPDRLTDSYENIKEGLLNFWDKESQYDLFFQIGDVYAFKISNSISYYYCKAIPSSRNQIENDWETYFSLINNRSLPKLTHDWKLKNANAATVTFEFVFSPKYNLTGGYSYLLIETDRTDNYHQSIQYVDDSDSKTYYGTRLALEQVDLELYTVSNLLERGPQGYSQIQSGSSSLSHIAIWGHPELMLAINGEEIKIGQSGYYELKDFTINSLGVIVNRLQVGTEQNPIYINDINDRFTIDYEYKIIS